MRFDRRRPAWAQNPDRPLAENVGTVDNPQSPVFVPVDVPAGTTEVRVERVRINEPEPVAVCGRCGLPVTNLRNQPGMCPCEPSVPERAWMEPVGVGTDNRRRWER